MDALDWTGISTAIATWVRNGTGLDSAHVFWAYEKRPRPPAPYIEMSVTQVRGVGHDWTTSEWNTFAFGTLAAAAVDPTTDKITITAHPFGNGDGPVQLTTTGTLPTGLALATDYWIIVVDPNTIKLAASYVATGGALPGGAGNPQTPVNFTDAGTGALSVNSTADTVPGGKEIVRRAQGFREVIVHFECFAQEGKGYDSMRILSNLVSSLQLNLYALDQAGVGVSDMGQAFSQGGVQHVEGHRGSILEPRSMVDLTFYLASDITGFDTIIASIDASIGLKSEGGADLPAIPVHVDLT